MQFLQPEAWKQPKGYANGVAAEGRMVFTGGMIGWNAEEVFETEEFAGQAEQALRNIVEVLAQAGAMPEHIVRMTWYVTSKQEYLGCQRELGAAYQRVIGAHFPAMALVQVVALVEDEAKVEIEATAVLPPSDQ